MFVNKSVRPRLIAAFLMMRSVTFGFWGVATFVRTYVGTVAAKAGLSAPHYSAVAGLLGTGVAVFGFITLGFLSDGIGRKPTTMLYYAMCLILTPILYLLSMGQGHGAAASSGRPYPVGKVRTMTVPARKSCRARRRRLNKATSRISEQVIATVT